MKLLIVGFDAADYFTIKKHGFFKKWRDESDWGCLKSIHSEDGVPHTGPMWSTMYTGKRPGQHGIVSGGWLFEHKTWKDLKCPTVFEEHSEVSWGLMTIPLTYPADARKVNGWVVSGYPTPDPDMASKPWFFGINVPMNDFRVDVLNYPSEWGPLNGKEKEKYIWKKGIEIDRFKLEKAKNLPEVDVLFIGFMQLDRIGHLGGEKSFLDCYEKSEKLLEDTFDAFKPDEMLVVSDHGMSIAFHRHNLDGFWLHWKRSGEVKEQDSEYSILEVHDMIEEVLK